MISHTQIYNPLPTLFSTISAVAAIHSLLSSYFLSNGVLQSTVMRIPVSYIAHFGVCANEVFRGIFQYRSDIWNRRVVGKRVARITNKTTVVLLPTKFNISTKSVGKFKKLSLLAFIYHMYVCGIYSKKENCDQRNKGFTSKMYVIRLVARFFKNLQCVVNPSIQWTTILMIYL